MSERSELISRLKNNRSSREAYVGAKLRVLIPSQIRALRLKSQTPRQEDLARTVGMKQSRISAMESPGAVNFNLETLVRLAAGLRVGLIVRFVSFSEMLEWENSFSQDTFEVRTIDDDCEFLGSSDMTQGVEDGGRAVVAELLGGKLNSLRGAGVRAMNVGQNTSRGEYLYETVGSNTSPSYGIYRNL